MSRVLFNIGKYRQTGGNKIKITGDISYGVVATVPHILTDHSIGVIPVLIRGARSKI